MTEENKTADNSDKKTDKPEELSTRDLKRVEKSIKENLERAARMRPQWMHNKRPAVDPKQVS